jgi:FO synthase
MNESISRAAGTGHGQEMPPERMDEVIASCGRIPQQRTTLYAEPPREQTMRAYGAEPLAPLVQTPPRKRAHIETVPAQP